ncbi:MAG: glutamine synthetase [Saccharopolyspora sp.]|uniref:glutamine synthetase family protein n=1 Tax=Saccharopolyspora sp. TaxID=33915 RepID=UPI0025D19018|nr:glutamine synthetase family protein [Saccharopolyspora sp.]MBQ6641762.1 glutamine synthetase [Saccharopolyspora sp.]
MTPLLDPRQLEGAGIHTVIVATPDLQGRLVGRRVPAERFPGILECGVEICTCAWAWDVEQSFDLIGAGVLAVCSMHHGAPDVALIPDVGTLRRAAWLQGVAICMADPVWPTTGEPLDISPRVLLKKELARYRDMGYSPQAGTELEFYLFANNPRALRKSGFRDDLDPTTLTPSDFMIHEGNGYEPFFQKLRRDLRDSGIEVEAGQSEWGTGQWEMTFAYGDPLEMADRHALYKLAVRDSAVAAGMSVTFMARPLNDQPGSSCHVHLSLLDDAGGSVFWNADAEHRMSDTLRSAVAGMLEHTPAFMAWYAPTVNSYRRTNSQEIAGYGRTWAVQNRSVSARIVGHTSSALRVEYRIPGADTNPYLTLCGVLASARDGIARSATPPAMTVGNAYDGEIDAAMPTQLAEAAEMFATSDFVRRLIGEENTSHFRHLAELEWRVYQSTVTQWDLQRYFDRI